MTGMIERVARAIIDQLKLDAARFDDFEQLRHDQRDGMGNGIYDGSIDAVALADAVIRAMRGPTEQMVLAGVHHENLGDMDGRWNAMIDAALKGKAL